MHRLQSNQLFQGFGCLLEEGEGQIPGLADTVRNARLCIIQAYRMKKKSALKHAAGHGECEFFDQVGVPL